MYGRPNHLRPQKTRYASHALNHLNEKFSKIQNTEEFGFFLSVLG